ncbi:MAG: VOC family protein [Elusimicrobiota bacterium]|nr:MAG: VOC family protein [Elusimicrobiota bacterium]
MIKHVAFTMYPVKNMARARKFYEKVLGLKKGSDYAGKWVEYYPGGTSCFALTNMVPGLRPAANIAFEVADMKKAEARLKKAGAKCVFKTYETPVCVMAAYRDTEGNSFTLHAKKK